MNERSPAGDPGLAYWLARDLLGMHTNEASNSRKIRMNDAFHTGLFMQVFPDNGLVPAHSLMWNGSTLFVGILGARSFTQLNAFFASAVVRATLANFSMNAASAACGDAIANHIRDVGVGFQEVILYGHSFGGTICQYIARKGIFELPLGYRHTCVTFGQPRFWQDYNDDWEGFDFSHGRWNNQGDRIATFPPRANEATLANALQDDRVAGIIAHTCHVGQGYLLNGSNAIIEQDVPTFDLPVADLSLWAFLFSNSSSTAQAHSLAAYVQRFTLYQPPGFETAYTPIGADFVLGIPGVEEPGRLMPAAQAAQVIQEAQQATAQSRGQLPEQSPFYAIKRGSQWACEYLGTTISTNGGKRNAQAMARRLNGAWRQWWRTKIASNDGLTVAISEAFPS